MARERRYAVGVTVMPVSDPPSEWEWEPAEPDPVREPETLPEMLPRGRSAAENAALLRQIAAAESMLAGLRVQAVMELAAARPAAADRQPGRPGAAADAGEGAGAGAPEGVSEFFADELALVLNCSRTAATVLTDQCAALWEKLPATLAALDAGGLDWPRARAIADELGWKAREVTPVVVAEVEAAVLPDAGELSIRQLKAAVRRELAARDAAAADLRRADAERGCDVTVRPAGDGVSELVARMPTELAAACRARVSQVAWAAKEAGDDRLLGVLRTGALADLVLQPWDDDTASVTAAITVDVPLSALTPDRFLADGAPLPAVSAPPGTVSAPTAEVDGEPITAAHVRRLLTDLDALCPGGLQPPAGGSLRYAFTDQAGGLLAVATDTELRTAARRGCPDHRTDTAHATDGGPTADGPIGDCGCPVLGVPAAVHRYQPSAIQVRYIHTRDRTCRHPGCAAKAAWSDGDHVVPHAAGGETSCENLCCLCRRHHRLKTFARSWTYAMGPDGTLTVTTPSGVTRCSRPHRRQRAATASRRRCPGNDPPHLPLTTPRVITHRPAPPAGLPTCDEDPPPY